MMKILLTGSCGFIFSNFIRKILYTRSDISLVSVDKVLNPNTLHNVYINKRHNFYIGDVADAHFVETVFSIEKPDYVIHGAAQSHVDNAISDAAPFILSNVLGTQIIVNACVKHKVEKLIYTSCYDEQTKAVTKDGLKSHDQLKIGELVLTINPNTGVMEEKEIEKIIVQDYDGLMCEFKSNRINALTTPNHRFLYVKDSILNWTTAEELNNISGKKYFPKGKINNIHSNKINIPEIGEIDSNAFFYVCGVFIGDGLISYQEKLNKNISGYTRKDFIQKSRDIKTGRFTKIFNKDSTQKYSVSKSYRIFFDVPQNDKCRTNLENSLTKLGINWYTQKNKSGEHIYFTSKEWCSLFEQFGKYAVNKHIPNWMFKYSYDNLFNLFLGIHDSDGHGFNKSGRSISITTISTKLRDQLCYLGSMLGFTVRFHKNDFKISYINGRKIIPRHDAWCIYFSKNRAVLFPKSETCNYNGKIWCLKVKDNKNFLVARGGITYLSGNTDEVYGQLTEKDNDIKWTEESPMSPRNPYSASKASGELIIKAAHTTHGLNYNITRSCNNFGPRQLAEKLIPKAIKNILNNEKVPIYGKGQQLREWIHVDDNCDAILTVLEKAPPNETYNISSGYEFSSLEMCQRICNEIGYGHNLLSFCEDRLGHDFRYLSDSSKLRSLGWKPEINFNEGLTRTVQWFINNRWYIR